MKKSLLLTLFLILSTFNFLLAQSKQPWREKEMEIKIIFTKPSQQEIIADLNFQGDIYNTHAYLYIVPEELIKLENTGIPFSITVPDLNARSRSNGARAVPNGYYTFTEIKNIADSLATNFPDICKKVIFGFTPQFEELAALKISDNVNVDENEAEILLDGGIHGDEVGGSQNIIQFARDLCIGYNKDAYITDLINNREIWLYYCVNPYGRNNMTRYNSSGVDLNRDFGYMWGGEGSSTAPFSQVETRALRDCVQSNQFVSYTNYHSGIEIISYPWSYRKSPPPDLPHIDKLASIYSTHSGYNSFPYGQGANVMYLIKGSTKDYNYGSLGSIAWSIEISTDKQPMGSQIQYYYNINKPAMLALIEHSGYGVHGTVTDAVTGLPIKASVVVDNGYPTFTDGDAGDFHKYLVPGNNYTLQISANGYESKTISNVVVQALQSTEVNVQLTPEQGHYAYKTLNCKIPNFNATNPGDEGATKACLGKPDQIYYSLGKGGEIMIDMLTPVPNLAGNDIKVIEGDNTPESYTLYALTELDGDRKSLGLKTGSAEFDLSSAFLSQARYFVIVDDNDGSANVNDAGFDFDAILSLHPPIPDTLGHISGIVADSATGLGIANAIVNFGDSTLITDNLGKYATTQTRGLKNIIVTAPCYNTHISSMMVIPAKDTTYNINMGFNVSTDKYINITNLQLFPNPFSTELQIEFYCKQNAEATIRLTPITSGNTILLTKTMCVAGKNHFHWDLKSYQNMPEGLYILSIETPLGNNYYKVIKY